MRKIALLATFLTCFLVSTVDIQPIEIDVTAYKETVWKKEA